MDTEPDDVFNRDVPGGKVPVVQPDAGPFQTNNTRTLKMMAAPDFARLRILYILPSEERLILAVQRERVFVANGHEPSEPGTAPRHRLAILPQHEPHLAIPGL